MIDHVVDSKFLLVLILCLEKLSSFWTEVLSVAFLSGRTSLPWETAIIELRIQEYFVFKVIPREFLDLKYWKFA